MERVLNQEENERNVDTKGVDIDVYFTQARDTNTDLCRKVPEFNEVLVHTTKYSVSGIYMAEDPQMVYYKLYKTPIKGGLVANGLTISVMNVDGMTLDEIKAELKGQ